MRVHRPGGRRRKKKKREERPERSRHPSKFPLRSTCVGCVGARLAGRDGGAEEPAHVTLFMNGALLTQGGHSSKSGGGRGGGVRRVRGWDAGEVEPPALTQSGRCKGGMRRRRRMMMGGEGSSQEQQVRLLLLLLQLSVSRTDRFFFCTTENPFVPKR